MKWNEAESKGFKFNGITYSKWNKEEERKQKERCEKLKKKFKGADYRIVTDTANSWLGINYKAIMVNDIFIKVQYFDDETFKKRIDMYEDDKEKLKEEYESKLADLKVEHDNLVKEYNEIKALER